MGDKALRGRGLLGVGKAKHPGIMSRQPPTPKSKKPVGGGIRRFNRSR